MRVAHLDCFSGISGDMTLGALIDAGVDAETIRAKLDSLNLPIEFRIEKIRKGGFASTYVRIDAPHEHKHRHLHHVEAIIDQGDLTEKQRALAKKIFRRLAEAEAHVHGIPLEKVHFHEVGALDSIADIVGAAIGFDLLGVDEITSSSVATGNGMVKCEHGMMPIPAPATAELLRGVPLRSTAIQGELTTPTGAAILTTMVSRFSDSPDMQIDAIGLGAGTMDLPSQPNILRLFVGTKSTSKSAERGLLEDTIWVLETNLDDIPAEVVGHCYDLLFAAGALDVYTTPIYMKKNRTGLLLTVLAPENVLNNLEDILFAETSTLGVRRYSAQRNKLHREPHSVETPWGPVKGKLSWRDGKPAQFSPEYDDCARIAREFDVPLKSVYAQANREFLSRQQTKKESD